MAPAPAHVEQWARESVEVSDVVRALSELRVASAADTAGPDIRMRVMNHIAWIPAEWVAAAMEVVAGLAERLPSRALLLVPDTDAGEDGIDARASVLAFDLPGQTRHLATEVVELRLRGRRTQAPASIVAPLLVSDLPVFLRWRGQPPFGADAFEQLLDLTDRLVVDSREWPDVPEAYRKLAEHFDRAACSDIAWRRTVPWRRVLADRWPGIAEVRGLNVRGPVAEANLLAGWLRSALGREIELEREAADELEAVAVDGEQMQPPQHPESGAPSDLLSAELDEFVRDRVYEAAVRAAF